MKRKFLVPLALTTTLLTTFGSSTLSVNALQTQQSQTKMHSFNQTVQQQSDIQKVLQELANLEQVKNQYTNYTVTDVEKDNLGYTHYTLNPQFEGTVAMNQEIKVHVNSTGKVVLVNGKVDAAENKPSNTVSISQEAATSNAFNALNMKSNEVDNLGADVVKSSTIEIDENSNKFIYSIEIITVSPQVGHWQVKVDAQSGQVTETKNLATGAAAQGTGLGVLGDEKEININSIRGGYSLEDVTHRGRIAAYDYNNSRGTATLFTSNNTTFNLSKHRAGVDANYYATQVYNYFKDIHGRESYDGQGSPIISLTHVNSFGGQSNLNNAAWVGDKMIYNDGDGRTFTGLSGAKDIVAHEITHGITQSSANLEYYAQSGALNESFSDVFGYFIDNDDWLMGEDVYTPKIAGDALRSMSNPTDYNQPDHMKNYVNTKGDNAGVHINSGIPNKAAYNTINRIGQKKAEKIYYRALTQYLTSQSQFKDAKQALYQSAIDLYDKETANAVWQSWDAVGV